MAERITHAKAVAANFKHMNTSPNEWTAMPIVGVCEEGLPVYALPTGYRPAPTLYPQSGGGFGDMNCELCAHAIRRAFYIVNNSKRWLLIVGSECVTHFQEDSGMDMVKQSKNDQMQAYINNVLPALKEIKEKIAHWQPKWSYGDSGAEWKAWHATNRLLYKKIESIKNLKSLNGKYKAAVDAIKHLDSLPYNWAKLWDYDASGARQRSWTRHS
jgi:hypothetical protein